MENINAMKRSIIMFNNEDTGYGEKGNPAGYVRIETRGSKGEIRMFIQNLKPGKNKYYYEIYLISCRQDIKQPIYIGTVKDKENSSELKWNFNTLNIKNTGYGIQQFDFICVLVRYINESIEKAICPLIAYINKSHNWRKRLNALFFSKDEGKRNEKEINVHGKSCDLKVEELKKAKEDEEYKEKVDFENQYIAHEYEFFPLLNKSSKDKEEKQKPDLELLKTMCQKYCKTCTPFNGKKNKQTWWKILNPVNFNNILYKCGVLTPILFNPSVIMSYYKYRHLIICIMKDNQYRKDYLAFGIPGVYKIDENPFGNLSEWFQTEGYKPRYGAFGYWIAHFEPNTGKIIKLK